MKRRERIGRMNLERMELERGSALIICQIPSQCVSSGKGLSWLCLAGSQQPVDRSWVTHSGNDFGHVQADSPRLRTLDVAKQWFDRVRVRGARKSSPTANSVFEVIALENGGSGTKPHRRSVDALLGLCAGRTGMFVKSRSRPCSSAIGCPRFLSF